MIFQRPVYGLRAAPRSWQDHLAQILLGVDFIGCKSDADVCVSTNRFKSLFYRMLTACGCSASLSALGRSRRRPTPSFWLKRCSGRVLQPWCAKMNVTPGIYLRGMASCVAGRRTLLHQPQTHIPESQGAVDDKRHSLCRRPDGNVSGELHFDLAQPSL